MGQSILRRLHQDHLLIKRLLEKLTKANDEVEKKETYLQLKEELLSHMEGEEKTIYSHLIEDVGDEDAEKVGHDAEYEHDIIRALFEKLDNVPIVEQRWRTSLINLQEQILKHLVSEEQNLFKEALKDFSLEELTDYETVFNEIREHFEP
jgi:hypothetical protein